MQDSIYEYKDELQELGISIYEVLEEMSATEKILLLIALKLMRRISELENQETEDD